MRLSGLKEKGVTFRPVPDLGVPPEMQSLQTQSCCTHLCQGRLGFLAPLSRKQSAPPSPRSPRGDKKAVLKERGEPRQHYRQPSGRQRAGTLAGRRQKADVGGATMGRLRSKRSGLSGHSGPLVVSIPLRLPSERLCPPRSSLAWFKAVTGR